MVNISYKDQALVRIPLENLEITNFGEISLREPSYCEDALRESRLGKDS